MKQLKYLPYIFALSLFFVGRFSSPQNDKELIRKYELDRKYHLDQISKDKAKLDDLVKAGLTIREKMNKDSLKYIVEMRAKDRVILDQRKNYEKISFSNADVVTLDSAINGLYSN